MAYDTWGGSWGTSWALSWTRGGTPPAPQADVIRNFSLREWRRWRRPQDDEQLKNLGIEPQAAEIIADVAARQASETEGARLDDQQRLDELLGELLLRGIEIETQHVNALNAERQQLIDNEIKNRLRLLANNRDLLALLLIAASQ